MYLQIDLALIQEKALELHTRLKNNRSFKMTNFHTCILSCKNPSLKTV